MEDKRLCRVCFGPATTDSRSSRGSVVERVWNKSPWSFAGLLGLALACSLSGCVSKGAAQAEARAAFVAGQQQAMRNMIEKQAEGPTVTFVGPVRNVLVPWNAQLTLAKAVVAADYFGQGDPSAIIIRRDGQEIPVDPKKLLGGEDVPLLPRDIVEIRP